MSKYSQRGRSVRKSSRKGSNWLLYLIVGGVIIFLLSRIGGPASSGLPSAGCQDPIGGSVVQVDQMIGCVFGPGSIMLKVADCESSDIPTNVNTNSPDYGLFQIEENTWNDRASEAGDFWSNWADPLRNAQAAYLISNGGTYLHDWVSSQWCWDPNHEWG